MIRERNLFPGPWGLLAVGCPMRGDQLHLNEPPEHDCTGHVKLLTIPYHADRPDEFWLRQGAWLRSTRKARLVRREEQLEARERQRTISPKARTAIANGLAPTSFFDCLWRMRIRANYGSADPFVTAYISESEHRQFHAVLTSCVDATRRLARALRCSEDRA